MRKFLDSILGTKRKAIKEQTERLRESIRNALLDGEITEAELNYINDYFYQSDLTAEQFGDIKNEIFRETFAEMASDRRINPNEASLLNQLIDKLEIGAETRSWAETAFAYFALFDDIESGKPLETVMPVGLILQKGEECYLCISAQLMEERVVSRNYQGGHSGVNIRVAKGIRFNVGGHKGKMVSQTGLVLVSDGYFIVTNKRVVFSGERKTVTTPIIKLIDVHITNNGIIYSVDGKAKSIIIQMFEDAQPELSALILSRLINS